MKKEMKLSLLVVAALGLNACSKTEFADVSTEALTKAEVPIDIPTDGPVILQPVAGFKVSNGACSSDSSTKVLSCLSCDVPQVVAVPQLSAKAQALADIMVLACDISNKSDLSAFRPTKDMIINKLNRGSEALYPESVRTSQMALTIAGLTNEDDASLRQKMFGGLWYQPPYSDAFETYFGLTVQEAKSTFCWDGNVQTSHITNPTGIMSKAYLDCTYGQNPYACQESSLYQAAGGYRAQLQNVLSKSISEPYSAPTPDPQKVCTWDKFEGDDVIEAKKQYKKWKDEGRKIAVEVKKASGAGLCAAATDSSLADAVSVVMASYICQ